MPANTKIRKMMSLRHFLNRLWVMSRTRFSMTSFFFFQAEGGIRVFHVTGVQTCALPISFEVAGEISFDVDDAQYAEWVRRIIADEICQGEGSNFLPSRKARLRIAGFSADAANTIFTRLARNELGAYMTFCFFDGERYFIGASPERHITVRGGTVVMNPICGTLPKAALARRADLVEFLSDPKEINELFQ